MRTASVMVGHRKRGWKYIVGVTGRPVETQLAEVADDAEDREHLAVADEHGAANGILALRPQMPGQTLAEDDGPAVVRLVGAILLEQDDEWAVAEGRYFGAESMQQPATPSLPSTAQAILAAIA